MLERNPTNHLGRLIKTARKEKNLTQAKLSLKLGITTRHLKSIENSGQNPSYLLFRRLITELDIPAELAIHPENKQSGAETQWKKGEVGNL